MRIFLSEYRHDYNTYTFGYTMYALYEQRSDLNEMYLQGFLPYTGNLTLQGNLYYKSRGLRVVLDQFKDNSENRRVQRKVAELKIQTSIIPIEEFCAWDDFYEFAHMYSSERIGEDKMPRNRLEYICSRKYLTHIIHFTSQNKTIAYILAIITDRIWHYWFAFYDTGYLNQSIPIGKWLMWKGIHLAKEAGCTYCFLGNGYNLSSQYKTRDFTGIEYYDGNGWNNDLQSFNQLTQGDAELKSLDHFKLQPDLNLALENHLKALSSDKNQS